MRSLFHELLRWLLDRFDLIVIDEAHKSREAPGTGDDPHPTKRRPMLLKEILQPAPGCRWIRLTATPVQLGTSYWRGILRRIGLEGPALERRLAAVSAFDARRSKFRSGPASEADVGKGCPARYGKRCRAGASYPKARACFADLSWAQQGMLIPCFIRLRTLSGWPESQENCVGCKELSLLEMLMIKAFPCKFPVFQGNRWLGIANLAPTVPRQGKVFRQ